VFEEARGPYMGFFFTAFGAPLPLTFTEAMWLLALKSAGENADADALV
jgi:hypothetical protein